MSKTRIIEAVKRLDLNSTKKLLKAKPSLVTATDRQGRNLLHLACSASCDALKVPEAVSIRLVNFLLDLGLDIESPVGPDACTVLFFAVARARNQTLVKLLIKRGAKAASAPGGGLFAAGWWEDLENSDLLIRAGSQTRQEVPRCSGIESRMDLFCPSICHDRKIRLHGRS
jgi:hypothetical protein